MINDALSWGIMKREFKDKRQSKQKFGADIYPALYPYMYV
jgi:hypothetical protein